MKSAAILLHLGESWFNFDGKKLTTSPSYPRCVQPVRVLDDFAGSARGVMSLEGASGHAAALIERKVRDEGLVDGESHILIHRRNSLAGAVQALYTAVPVESWQRAMSWAEAQPDHCMVMPLAALLFRHLSPGKGIIFYYGRQFVLLAQQGKMMLHGAIQAYSAEMDDLESAIAMLGEQLQASRTEGGALELTFCPLRLAVSQEQEDTLKAAFTRATQIVLHAAPSVDIEDHNGIPCRSSLPYLLQPWTARDAVNPLLSKWLARAEEMLPVSAMVGAVIAFGLFVYGAYLINQSDIQNERTRQLAHVVADKERASAQFKSTLALPASYTSIQGFYRRLSKVAEEYNPYRALTDVRVAVGKELRIMRLRFEGGDHSSLILDGAMRQSTPDTRVLADFTLRLRAAGYEVTPVESTDSSLLAPHFSYRLRKGQTP